MGAAHFLMQRRHKVTPEMALTVLARSMKRVIAILGCRKLREAMQTQEIFVRQIGGIRVQKLLRLPDRA